MKRSQRFQLNGFCENGARRIRDREVGANILCFVGHAEELVWLLNRGDEVKKSKGKA